MKEKIIKAMVEGCLLQRTGNYIVLIFRKVIRRIDYYIGTCARAVLAKRIPVQDDKILFMTTRGGYNCNPKAIAEEIIRRNLPWQLVWVARQENMKMADQFPQELKIVIRGTYEFYKEAASAKIWIDNSTSLSYLNTWKKPDQMLIETWHGSLGLKRVETTTDKRWIKKATACGKRTDLCISNSTFETNLYRNTFWKSAEILEYGHARNDVLLTDDTEKVKSITKEVREYFGIRKRRKVAIYAPTYRDGQKLEAFQIDYEMLRKTLINKFGGDWCVLVRFHFNLRKQIKKSRIVFPSFVLDATDYPDIQDLLLVADVGITDYSSWICDYVLTRKPGFIFATDYEHYYSERGFYYPLETTPFPLATNNDELMGNICSFDLVSYQRKCDEFIADKGCIDDGRAAERVVDKLMELM